MHLPPNDEEKYSYLNTDRFYFYLFGSISLILLSAGMMFFASTMYEHHAFSFVLFVLYGSIIFYLSLAYFLGIFAKDFDLKRHNSLVLGTNNVLDIDIYLPVCGEPLEIIKNTFSHVSELCYKSPHNIKTYVLDDKNDAEVKELASAYSFEYISRPNLGEHKKAGNLRYAFERTTGEFIAIFDADFCPRTDFFEETMKYFFTNPKIGIVQTPQFFDPSACTNWIDRGSAIIQILFYKMIQVNRDYWQAPICVGTNAVYRRSALEPFGGTALIGYSEDLHTGFNVTNAGGLVKFLPINVTSGLCPNKMAQYFNQQYRWCMGSFTLFTTKAFWTSKLSMMQFISYLSGMIYYQMTALSLFINPIPSILMLFLFPKYIVWYSFFYSIPSLIFGCFYFAYWTGHWNILDVLRARQFSYYAYLFAIKDKLFGNLMEWIPTGASNQAHERFKKSKRLLFTWNLLVLSVIFFMAGFRFDLVSFAVLPTLLLTTFWFYVSISVLTETSD